MKRLGLIGYPLSHSFSKKYFTQKIDNQHLIHEWKYDLYPIENIEKLPELLRGCQNELVGLNVTIPYKELVIPYLDDIDEQAALIKAVNCIKITWNDDKKPHLKGYNTDATGFEMSLRTFLNGHILENLQALILGTGGAAKAVIYTCNKLNIPYICISRTASKGTLTYDDLTEHIMKTHRLIINTTPLGMSPHTEGCPLLPFQYIDNQHFIYDLIYNPSKTRLMEQAEARGAKTQNGLDMLYKQAEEAWIIWNKNDA